MGPPLFSLGVYVTGHESSLCAQSAEFPPLYSFLPSSSFLFGERGASVAMAALLVRWWQR